MYPIKLNKIKLFILFKRYQVVRSNPAHFFQSALIPHLEIVFIKVR